VFAVSSNAILRDFWRYLGLVETREPVLVLDRKIPR
jgi:hypothetical protein